MIDFIAYVVAELRQRRLSRADALDLLRQFSARAAKPQVLHPLLHANDSDLDRQSYVSLFTGDEFFLRDHRFAGRRVLPGVAYLEMARAALARALPATEADALSIELRDVAWAQALVVSAPTEVRVSLALDDAGTPGDEELHYEIESWDGERALVHGMGRARRVASPAPVQLDVAELRTRLTRGSLDAAQVYAFFDALGVEFGPGLRTLTAVHRGQGEALAELRLPEALGAERAGYGLHPSLLDGAIQAAVGLLEDPSMPGEARVPFALQRLRVLSECAPVSLAWVRAAADTPAAQAGARLDVDLCDEAGRVCVQMQGLSLRALPREARSSVAAAPATDLLLAAPEWQARPVVVPAESDRRGFTERHVLVFDLPAVEPEALAAALGGATCVAPQVAEQPSVAQRYSACAAACFASVRAILERQPRGQVLVQVAVAERPDEVSFAGLAGLLRSACLEHPALVGQVLCVARETTTETLARLLRDEAAGAPEALVRHVAGVRQVRRWRAEATSDAEAPSAFAEHGVYLITGGLGGLGTAFARAILDRAAHAHVVLTGRAPLSAEREAQLAALSRERVAYRQVNLAELAEVTRLVQEITARHGRLNGILHAAGMNADAFILKKSQSEIDAVLEPKVLGTCHLDLASRDVPLDFFVLFASLAGLTGNLGQADYAAANGFMDEFAAARQRLVARGERHGRTLSLDWGFWQGGGMQLDPSRQDALARLTGMRPMAAAAGLAAFHRGLATSHVCLLAVAGDRERLTRALLGEPEPAPAPLSAVPTGAHGLAVDALRERTLEFLRGQVAGVLELSAHKLDPQAGLDAYGIDSILALKLTERLEETFGALPKTLFFEHQTLAELSGYFVEAQRARLEALFAAPPAVTRPAETVAPAPTRAPAPPRAPAQARARRWRRTQPDDGPLSIAVVGLSGRYPEARDVAEYWRNLRDGRDCIIEVPKQRWDLREYYDPDRTRSGCHFSKWGGFLAGVDEFDPLFFGISPAEAEFLDPQERLFLQHAWAAVEDAGYTRATLQTPSPDDLPAQVGVYVGVMFNEYQLLGAEASLRGRRMAFASNVASIANRVSYVFNLHGPSLALDTMCSSSLSAIHVACQDLRQGRTHLAIAGGVNVSIHPNKYLVLSALQAISSDGHCQSFGEGGDGYIPGEGVGVVVLKRLWEAERDGDHVYGVIRGSALNHGGKTNGYTVPNPQAQAAAIQRALSEARVDARHVSYVEAHGTGTKLGDPIEIAALSKAFGRHTSETGFCLLGSAKSNVGHCESAAGIAGLTKVLLQMKHGQIVPSLHSERLNPHIDFERTPFVVNQKLCEWKRPVIEGRESTRIAGLSSFGAGGSNAHLIVEEYQGSERRRGEPGPVAVVVSARTVEQLREKAGDLSRYVREQAGTIELSDVAYTLQVGREGLDERLGFVAHSLDELASKLDEYVGGAEDRPEVYRGQVKKHREALSVFGSDTDLRETVARWIEQKKLHRLTELWTKGLEVDWNGVYGEARPRRVSLPTYPFARERYWIEVPEARASESSAWLHPLLQSNTSDLSEQRYTSRFKGDEFFVTDHQVRDGAGVSVCVLPGVAQLEMARAALEHALPRPAPDMLVELRQVVWARPVVVHQALQLHLALAPLDDEQVEFEIYSAADEGQLTHGQGRAGFRARTSPAQLDVERLRSGLRPMPAESLYGALSSLGIMHGPALRSVVALEHGGGQALARLRLPAATQGGARAYVLHPALLDGALHACAALVEERPATPRLPFALEQVRVFSGCEDEMLAWVRYAPGSQAHDALVKLDVDLCALDGRVCVELRGLSTRPLRVEDGLGADTAAASACLMATPVWQASALAHTASADYAERHVLLCELEHVDAQALESSLPGSRCLALRADASSTLAERYSAHALACFERLQGILQGKPQGRVLVQVVCADEAEGALFAGLSGLLKTAALENPQLAGQVLLVPRACTLDELAQRLRAEAQGQEPLVRYERGERRVLRWQEADVEGAPEPLTLREDGVYLISGGLGGLGLVFAREILARASRARVVLLGRSPLDAPRQARLEALAADGRASYRQVDLARGAEVEQALAALLDEHGRLDGLLHAAGVLADSFIVKKTSAQFQQVLAPKVAGAFHLDEASRAARLDFFVLFSSLTSVLGNLGQADYAAANGFLDRFAAYRNAQVEAGLRHGRTRAIHWPLWQAGGMRLDAQTEQMLARTTGIRAMRSESGLRAFHRSLTLPADELLVAEGDLGLMRRALLQVPSPAPVAPAPVAPPEPLAASQPEALRERLEAYLRRELAQLLKLPAQNIDAQAALEDYGIDSISALKLTNRLEQAFGPLSKTLLFEYQTLALLAGYFAQAHATAAAAVTGQASPAPSLAPATREPEPQPHPRAVRTRARRVVAPVAKRDEIAVIGLAGRYPQARDLREFWRNLRDGRDCIEEIPRERWDHALFYAPEKDRPGKSYSKWGGFLADVDRFDALFFGISPKEAELIDPQERLFLETAWHTLEDAGYARERVRGLRAGVYVGVMWGQYELFGAEAVLQGRPVLPSSSHASIANRVSYFFDWRGPSLAVDTMCSSSLTAIHLACEELRRGGIEMALAGGVNLSLHPYKYLSLSQGHFAASDGRCRAFGQGGDGYVPGEGVGALLLKPLEAALRDGDQIHALIRASALNHGGKTNGYTVPNPNAQAELIADALRQARIDPRTLGYVEAHGTGTSLGDPIEITGLMRAFGAPAEGQPPCALGSVKSNIGHLESAAGIAAVTKVLLQMRHRQLVPSLHATPANPHVDWQAAPFRVQTELADWHALDGQPRRAGVSSFGAGGSNAHLVLEEWPDTRAAAPVSGRPELCVLSAKDDSALVEYVDRLTAFLADPPVDLSLADVAHTLRVGRSAMDARLAVVAVTLADLLDKLKRWSAARAGTSAGDVALTDVFDGHLRQAAPGTGHLVGGQAGRAFLDSVLADGDLERLARLWLMGVEPDWQRLGAGARRVSLPLYPFARERFWLPEAPTPAVPAASAAPALAEEKRVLLYEARWTSRALSRSTAALDDGALLVVEGSAEAFAELRARDERAVWLRCGGEFAEPSPDAYVVDPAQPEHFGELLARLARRGLRPSRVLHHAARHEALEESGARLTSDLGVLFQLCQALLAHAPQTPLRVLAAFWRPLPEGAPAAEALGGFLKTLAIEQPRWRTKLVGWQSQRDAGEPRVADWTATLWDELHETDWSADEVLYEAEATGEPALRRVREWAPLRDVAQRAEALPLRREGVYLVTGGLGGLGLVFAEHLAQSVQARLVLVGRSLPDARQQARLERLREHGAQVLVVQADVARLDDVQRVVRAAKERFGVIHGVLHGAGVNRDALIRTKELASLQAVTAPKVAGALHVDLATREEALDFLLLFSSLAGVLGSPGQCDYAYGNRFLDAFAEQREALRARGQRAGRTLSIAWPLWEAGGMRSTPAQAALLEQQTGLCALPTPTGLRCFDEALRGAAVRPMVLYGWPSRIVAALAGAADARPRPAPAPAAQPDGATLLARVELYLKTLIGEELKLAPERIGSAEALETFGIDSVMISRITTLLERDLGPLSKTLLYEHGSVGELARFLTGTAREALTALLAPRAPVSADPVSVSVPPPPPVERATVANTARDDEEQPIAVIGMHGRYPRSATLEEYWANLRAGRDLIDVVPATRWDAEALFDPDPAAAARGQIYCKWGGFIADHDRFDASFFGLGADEAASIDPQERLFLESVWAALEDAGYTRASLRERHPKGRSADVGVFVGVTTNSYHLWAPEALQRGHELAPTSLPWSIANRVSYFFDFNGPSLPVDTACSSSLVALHLACESLRQGACQLAVAGGVNLYLHPAKYQALCQGGRLSRDGRCHSYGAGGEGWVPGEGVGAVVLKPLARALADGDEVQAVIRATAFGHSGRAHGYSAPNPQAQAALVAETLARAGVPADTLGYVEGHGTGTQLGDSLEVAALSQAFARQTGRRGFCALGSVKANLGHSESAAGMAGLAKVVLQLRHAELAPALHADEVNPNIELAESPFYLQRELAPWKRPDTHPRRALINAFGAGGVSACALVEEAPPARVEAAPVGARLFVLSARSAERLRAYVERLRAFLDEQPELDLARLCLTLQSAREAFEERLATVVSSTSLLRARLDAWLETGSAVGVRQGRLRAGSLGGRRAARGPAPDEAELDELGAAWTAGDELDWDSLYTAATRPRRMRLPGYPFARQRHWAASAGEARAGRASDTRLHPLIAHNSSTLAEFSLHATLAEHEFYARDHVVAGEALFPGAGFLELACVAGNLASERRVRKLSDVVFLSPLSFRGGGSRELGIALRPLSGQAEFVVASRDVERAGATHCEGRLAFEGPSPDSHAAERESIQTLRERCRTARSGADFYQTLARHGLHYGPAFQVVREIHVCDAYALARLELPAHLREEFGRFTLHPSLIDGALQTAAALLAARAGGTPHVPFAVDEVAILRRLPWACYAHVELAPGSAPRQDLAQFNVRLLDEDGQRLLELTSVLARPLGDFEPAALAAARA